MCKTLSIIPLSICIFSIFILEKKFGINSAVGPKLKVTMTARRAPFIFPVLLIFFGVTVESTGQ